MPIILVQAEQPPAAVAPAAAVGSMIGARWLRKPSPADMEAYYPKVAAITHTAGRALVGCQVNAEGRLEACQVEEEQPLGEGFGEAAARLVVDKFKMRPKTADGMPVAGGKVRIPIRFSTPGVRIPPIKAQAPGLAGQVEIDCRIAASLKFDNCFVDESDAAAKPLAAAALEVAGTINLPPGAAIGLRVVIPVDFVAQSTAPGAR
jgi:TonB family protein